MHPHDHLLVALRRVIRAVDMQSRQLVQQQNFTVPQLLTLKVIAAASEITLGALAKRVGLSNATVSGIVDRLEQRGLVTRRRGPTDRRQTLISLTAAGSAAVVRSPSLLQERFTTSFDALGESKQRRLIASMNTIAAMMGAEHLDAAPLLLNHPATATEQMMVLPEAEPNKGEQATVAHEDDSADGGRAAAQAGDLIIQQVAAAHDFPDWLDIDELATFLHAEMQPYHDSPKDIRRGLSGALSGAPAHGGFILLASRTRQLVGALVMLATGMSGYAPGHMLLFVAVRRNSRGGGVGRRLIERALSLTAGNVKLHVEYENPARRLYERLGFVSKYAEMRYNR